MNEDCTDALMGATSDESPALASSGESMDSVFSMPADLIPLPVFVVDGDGLVLRRNAAAQNWLEVRDRLPEGWMLLGPVLDALRDGKTARGVVELPRRSRRVRLTCSPGDCGLFVLVEDLMAIPSAVDRVRFYEDVGAIAGVGGWELDLQTMTPLWSDEVCRIHGVPPGYVPDLNEAITFYAPEARPLIEAAVQRGIEFGESWDLELPFITAQNKRIWVRARGAAIMEGGKCVRVLGTFQDVTEQRQGLQRMHQALQQTSAYESLFRNANAMVALANMEGRFIQLNQRWSEVLGWDIDTLLNTPFLEFVHPDDHERTSREAAALSEFGYRTVDFTNRYRCKDGSYVQFSWVATSDPMKGLIYAVAHDVTRERARADQLERLALIASRTTNAVLITNQKGGVEWANESFTRITGYAPEEIIGRRPGELLQGPETDMTEVNRIRACIKRREGFRAKLVNYRKSGEKYWIAIEAQPLFDGVGRFTGFMAIEADVTEEHNAKQALIAARDEAETLAKEARAAAKAKSDFLAVMSHELRTPMNGILGTAELLGFTELTEHQAGLLATLRTAGQGLLSLLNDVLDYSKFDSGSFEVEHVPYDLPGTLSGACALFDAESSRRNLFLRTEISPDLPRRALGDELRVRQVLINLLGNAFKFTETGGVSVRAFPSNSGMLRVEVIDTGIGIPAERIPLLFRPFSQVDTSARRRFGGTGLGLAICRRLVDLMGGQAGLESTVGVGSTFWFELPLEAATEVQSSLLEGDGETREPLGIQRVLLVEDNPVNRLVTGQMLAHLGVEVVFAVDGVAALAELARQDFDLVLMDCHMPRLDGWSATVELRLREAQAEPPGRRTLVVAQTASCMAQDVKRCQDAGMDDLLSKPIQIAALSDLLRRWSSPGASPAWPRQTG